MSFDDATISFVGHLDLKQEKNKNSTSNTYSSWRTLSFLHAHWSCTAKTIFTFQLILMTFRNTTQYRMMLDIFWTKHVRQESFHDPNGICNTIRRSYIDPSYYITAKFRSNSATTLLNTPQICLRRLKYFWSFWTDFWWYTHDRHPYLRHLRPISVFCVNSIDFHPIIRFFLTLYVWWIFSLSH